MRLRSGRLELFDQSSIAIGGRLHICEARQGQDALRVDLQSAAVKIQRLIAPTLIFLEIGQIEQRRDKSGLQAQCGEKLTFRLGVLAHIV